MAQADAMVQHSIPSDEEMEAELVVGVPKHQAQRFRVWHAIVGALFVAGFFYVLVHNTSFKQANSQEIIVMSEESGVPAWVEDAVVNSHWDEHVCIHGRVGKKTGISSAIECFQECKAAGNCCSFSYAPAGDKYHARECILCSADVAYGEVAGATFKTYEMPCSKTFSDSKADAPPKPLPEGVPAWAGDASVNRHWDEHVCSRGRVGKKTGIPDAVGCFQQCKAAGNCCSFSYAPAGDKYHARECILCSADVEYGEVAGATFNTYDMPCSDTFSSSEADAPPKPEHCGDGIPLTPLPSNSPECPPLKEVRTMPSCDKVGKGDLCEGDGECGTTNKLNNCPRSWDVYKKR